MDARQPERGTHPVRGRCWSYVTPRPFIASHGAADITGPWHFLYSPPIAEYRIQNLYVSNVMDVCLAEAELVLTAIRSQDYLDENMSIALAIDNWNRVIYTAVHSYVTSLQGLYFLFSTAPGNPIFYESVKNVIAFTIRSVNSPTVLDDIDALKQKIREHVVVYTSIFRTVWNNLHGIRRESQPQPGPSGMQGIPLQQLQTPVRSMRSIAPSGPHRGVTLHRPCRLNGHPHLHGHPFGHPIRRGPFPGPHGPPPFNVPYGPNGPHHHHRFFAPTSLPPFHAAFINRGFYPIYRAPGPPVFSVPSNHSPQNLHAPGRCGVTQSPATMPPGQSLERNQ